MKCIVIYYSQTGNTAKIARAIHRGMSRRAQHCDIATVREISPQDVEKYDLIGLGSPVWMGAETPNVRNFIESVPRQEGRHIFSFCTHGVMPEQYFPTVVRRLKNRGFTVIGTKDWYGSVHFQLAPSPYYTEGHPDETDLQEAEEFGAEMVAVSQRIAAGETGLIPPVPPYVYTHQLWVLAEFLRSGHNPHGRLKYDPEKCNYPKCRLCMDNCLMGYIDLAASPRIFGSEKTECDMWMGCTFCEMICPTGAISCDWEEFAGQTAALHAMFDFNPLEKAAEEQVAAGKLRLLIPMEEVRHDRPYFLVHARRPRFKLGKEK